MIKFCLYWTIPAVLWLFIKKIESQFLLLTVFLSHKWQIFFFINFKVRWVMCQWNETHSGLDLYFLSEPVFLRHWWYHFWNWLWAWLWMQERSDFTVYFWTWFVIAHVSTVHLLIQLDNSYLGVASGFSISGGGKLAVEKLTKAFVKLKQQKNNLRH